ncbi:MAG: hypothetical protein M3297_13665, partial [Thermoproteota archaeon]|nr:hypothetical protein [Thermoproteota archaeon]
MKDASNKDDNRKKFACPFCSHRSSRKWNMQVHIYRWHADKDKNRNNEHSPSAQKKPESLFEPINEFHRVFVDAKDAERKMREMINFRRGNSYLSYPPQVHGNMGNIAPPDFENPPMSHTPTRSFNANILSPSFSYVTPTTDPLETRKEKILGLRAWICKRCIKIVIEAFYAVEKSGKDLSIITRNNHVCSPPKFWTNEEVLSQMSDLIANFEKLPLELKRAVRGWTGKDAYLVALK